MADLVSSCRPCRLEHRPPSSILLRTAPSDVGGSREDFESGQRQTGLDVQKQIGTHPISRAPAEKRPQSQGLSYATQSQPSFHPGPRCMRRPMKQARVKFERPDDPRVFGHVYVTVQKLALVAAPLTHWSNWQQEIDLYLRPSGFLGTFTAQVQKFCSCSRS
jgi:hypothetical protein